MTSNPFIELRDGKSPLIHLMCGVIPTNNVELRELYTVLAGYFKGITINTATWGGMVTTTQDNIETIQGWYGAYASADHVARSLIKRNKATGARAYACISEYGTCAREIIPTADDETDKADEVKDSDRAPVTLDNWA